MEKMIRKKKELKLSGKSSFPRLKMIYVTERIEERAQIKVFKAFFRTNWLLFPEIRAQINIKSANSRKVLTTFPQNEANRSRSDRRVHQNGQKNISNMPKTPPQSTKDQ